MKKLWLDSIGCIFTKHQLVHDYTMGKIKSKIALIKEKKCMYYFPMPHLQLVYLFVIMILPVQVFGQTNFMFQYGSMAAIGAHPAVGSTQSIMGLRFGNPIDDPFGYELGLLYSSAGWFIDTETYLNANFKIGDASANALLVIGIPLSFIGDPFYIQGGDITFGPGLFISQPVGSMRLEFRGETLTNLLSGLRGESGDNTLTNSQTGSSVVLSGRPFYLLLRLNGDLLIPMNKSTDLHIGISYLNFHTWQMTSAVLGVLF